MFSAAPTAIRPSIIDPTDTFRCGGGQSRRPLDGLIGIPRIVAAGNASCLEERMVQGQIRCGHRCFGSGLEMVRDADDHRFGARPAVSVVCCVSAER
jgi:hypothetical protein